MPTWPALPKMCRPLEYQLPISSPSAVGFGHALDLILFLDGIAVGRFLRRIHDLVGQALCNGLDVSEGAVASTCADEVDRLVDTTQRRNIDSLAPHHTSRTHTSGILPRPSILHRVNHNLDGILVRQEVDDLEGMLDDADSHELLAVVPTMHHHGAAQPLHNWAQGLAEAPLLIAALGVWQEGLCTHPLIHSDIIDQTQIGAHDIIVIPAAKKLRLRCRHFAWYAGMSADKLAFESP